MASPPKSGETAAGARFHAVRGLLRICTGSFRDLVPIIVVIGFFQIVVLQQPFPDLERVLIGLVFVVVGLSLFVQGLEIGLFPLGESMAGAFARKGVREVLRLGIIGHALHPVEIGAGGEASALGPEHHGTDPLVGAEAGEHRGQLGDQGVVEGVVHLRPGQGDPADAVVVDLFQKQGLQHDVLSLAVTS